MPHADFVHLRVHSAYSLSEGALKIKDLISLARAERMAAVAVTGTLVTLQYRATFFTAAEQLR